MTVDPALHAVVVCFVDEARELTQEVTLALLDLDKPDERGRAHERIARGLHTLKGSAATLGLEALAELAHRMEDVLAPWAAEVTAPPPLLVDALLAGLDAFNLRLAAEAEGREPPPSLDEVMKALAPAEEDTWTAETRATHLAASVGDERTQGDPEREDAGEAERADERQEDESWRVRTEHVVGLMADVDRLRVLRLRLDERRRELVRALDELNRVRGALADTAEVRLRLANIARRMGSDGEESADVVDSLDEGLKAICTLQVGTVLDPLRRAVRDICRETAKSARLSVVGAELSLDRRVLQGLRGPLVHLLTNAVDHGIEPPAIREARGKDPQGFIVIRVEQQGNLLSLSVVDDGAGLDTEAIADQAVRRGIVSREEAEQLPADELHQLIFFPGFSTASAVSARSGRGVGLDVVRAEVQALRGQVSIETRRGQGTTFRITLPVELGSSPLLVVRAAEHRLGIPMAAVEAVGAARADRVRVGLRRVELETQDQLLPAHDLGAALHVREPVAPTRGRPYVVVHAHGERAAFFVDEVVGHFDLSVRPLPHEVRGIAAYDGAATLAGGEPLLVLRPEWLARREAADDAPVLGSRRALVVDDSLTARALQRAMLEAGGFVVHTASDGRGALEHLRHAAYEVLVCDVGLEGMTGLELTRAVRGAPDLRRMPIVLVSANDGEEARARAREAGADAFLSKKECASGRLLEVVAAVVAAPRRAT